MGDVETVAKDKLKIAAFPANYFEYASLALHFKDAKDFSIDETFAKKKKKVKANVPGNYVNALQTDLATIGYLENKDVTGSFDAVTARAVLRFQRHAARVYRMPDKADVAEADTFKGGADGICDQATAKEVQTWIKQKYVIPV
ncbi:MAG TPA: peptidoglycan-binding domain-containing protein, partial [Polyangiaceae bacterium]|nr:peptidoglycan-binding domain-containing protein [Polyangiaceae bacterium]